MKEKDARYSAQEGAKPRGKEAGQDDLAVDINTDENISGTMGLDSRVTDGDEVEKLKEELQAQKEKYLRLFAEFDNFRKRSAKERLDLETSAGRSIIVSLLDVLDDCDRAEKQLQNSQDINEIKAGVQLVFNKLRTVMQSRGLRAMETLHQDFDVEKHEAINEIPAPTEALKGKVIDEVTKGYYLGDKIIRFAKVIVGK
jgi:molecular chaperone GrpE